MGVQAEAGIGFVSSGGVAGGTGLKSAERQELIEGAEGGSLEGGGVALQGGEGAGRVVAQGGGHHGVGIGGVAVGDHVRDEPGFQTTDAGEAPAGLGHFFDEKLLVGVGGGEGAVVFGD
ncbi:MAG: hypothetical protein ABSF98_19165 [Bryobacteraceae bacterium]|jgi:hypothetical protein